MVTTLKRHPGLAVFRRCEYIARLKCSMDNLYFISIGNHVNVRSKSILSQVTLSSWNRFISTLYHIEIITFYCPSKWILEWPNLISSILDRVFSFFAIFAVREGIILFSGRLFTFFFEYVFDCISVSIIDERSLRSWI